MKATELRIGNLVLGELEDWAVGRVINILGDRVSLDIDSVSYLINEIQPIPLTEKWLLRFGFIDNTITCGMIEISVRPFETVIQGIIAGKWMARLLDDVPTMLRSIQYVHELQNLYFALTGEELSIS